ncbi:unnamed protein product [Musa hybrid cultivar]
MAGGGKRGAASCLLLVTLLAFFYLHTDCSAARVTPRPQSLARGSGTECVGSKGRWAVLHMHLSSHLPTYLVHLRRRMARLLPFRLHQLRVCPQRVHLPRSRGLQGLRGRLLSLA